MAKSLVRDQRGVAMLFEVLVLGLLVAAVGILGYRIYTARQAATDTTSAVTSSAPDTAVNGRVSNAVNAVIVDGTTDIKDGEGDDSSGSDTDAATGNPRNLEGSYDETSF